MSMLYDTPQGAVAMELDKLFANGVLKKPYIRNGNGSTNSYPPVDVLENEDAFLLTANMPGLEL